MRNILVMPRNNGVSIFLEGGGAMSFVGGMAPLVLPHNYAHAILNIYHIIFNFYHIYMVYVYLHQAEDKLIDFMRGSKR